MPCWPPSSRPLPGRRHRPRRAARNRSSSRWPPAPAGRSPPSTWTPRRPAWRCCATAATPSTPRSRPRPPSASPRPTRPASAAAGSWSSTWPASAGWSPSTAARPPRPPSRGQLHRPGHRPPIPSPSGSPAASGSGCRARWRPGSGPCAYGTRPLGKLLEPAIRVAERGFVVDQTFHDQTASNAARFAAFPATAELFLPGGAPPAVGSVLRNPDLARPTGCWPATAPPLLPGPDRRGDRRHRPGPARRPGLDPERPARPDDRGRPGRLPGPGPGPDPGRLPRLPGLRHGPAVQRRLHRRRGPQHPGGLRPGRRATPRPCSTTWRRPGWPSPTATAGSATRTSSTCPCAGCSARASPTSAAA